MHRRLGLVALLAASLTACDDGTGAGPAMAFDRGSPRQVADEGVPVDAAVPPGDARVDAAAGDAALAVCDDAQCDAGQVCIDGECADGTRCDADRMCPAGEICVADLCLPDPLAAGSIAAIPEQLSFTFDAPGDAPSRRLTLQNLGDDTLQVQRFEFIGPGGVTFEIREAPELPIRLVSAQMREIVVGYRADDAIPDRAILRVHTDANATVDVALASESKDVGQARPCLNLRPARLDFGAVARGNDRTMTFHLESCGTVPVAVNGIRRGMTFFGPLPDTFQLTNPPPFPLEIAPGDRAPIEVTYAPQRAGIEAGHWEIISTDAQSPSQQLEVSGLATQPPLEDVGLHVRMEWDTDLTDVDLHVLGPNGQMWTCEGDCYFSNPNPDWGAQGMWEDDPFLDLDDVDGFGPENVNIQDPLPGTYRVVAQYWDDHGGDAPEVTVEILSFDQVVGRYGPVRLSDINDEWDVVEIDWPGLALRPLGNQVVSRNRGQLCGGF